MKLFRQFTWQSLKANRSRTLVTIIGIILSVALLTAVAAGAYSGQQYMVEVCQAMEGNYHAFGEELSKEALAKLENEAQVTSVATLERIGYAQGNELNAQRPYLYLAAASANLQDLLAVHLEQGRLPFTEDEIALPTSYLQPDGKPYHLGSTLELETGIRQAGGQTLWQDIPLRDDETFTPQEKHTYTVVGLFQPLDYILEWYDAPAYTALTGGAGDGTYLALFTVEKPRQIYQLLDSMTECDEWKTNSNLLLYYGASGNQSVLAVLYGMMAILLGLIMFGSIALIYNSFSISVAERTKQFGLLKSIGATRRQIRYSVLYEALVLCCIAIPIGLAVGCAGIGVTLYCLRDTFQSFFGVDAPAVVIRLHLVPWALLLSAAIGLVTTLISAWLPARRAMRLSPIAALRQTTDIRIRPRQVRTSALTERLFGYTGTLAAKNFKRNRRQYRATVLSLFMSLVLFLSASAFSWYLKQGVNSAMRPDGYDIAVTLSEEDTGDPEQMLKSFLPLEGVQEGVFFASAPVTLLPEKADLSPEYQDLFDDLPVLQTNLIFLRDADYQALRKQSGVPETAEPVALVYDNTREYYLTGGSSKLVSYATLRHDPLPDSITQLCAEPRTGYTYTDAYYDGAGQLELSYLEDAVNNGTREQEDADDGWLELPADGNSEMRELQLGTALIEQPYYVSDGLFLIYPYSAWDKIAGVAQEKGEIRFLFRASNHKQAYNTLQAHLTERQISGYVHDNAADAEGRRAVITVVNVFSYGFIVLISLIAAANVFNTISTNIALRRRELAVLQSVGMSRRDVYRMMNFECLRYGLKSLLWGLPVSAAVCWLIYRSVDAGYETAFTIPWVSVVIAVVSVFVVVFATMLYAMHKLRRDNIIDILRAEAL